MEESRSRAGLVALKAAALVSALSLTGWLVWTTHTRAQRGAPRDAAPPPATPVQGAPPLDPAQTAASSAVGKQSAFPTPADIYLATSKAAAPFTFPAPDPASAPPAVPYIYGSKSFVMPPPAPPPAPVDPYLFTSKSLVVPPPAPATAPAPAPDARKP